MFFVAARYRLPLQVTLLVASAGAVPWLADLIRARHPRGVTAAAALAGLAILVTAWPTGLDDGRAEERARMGLYELDQGRLTAGEGGLAVEQGPAVHYSLSTTQASGRWPHPAAGRS